MRARASFVASVGERPTLLPALESTDDPQPPEPTAMIEPSAFDDPRERAALSTDRAMRVLESSVALIAFTAAILLAVVPH